MRVVTGRLSERQTHELELGLCHLQSAHAELPEPQNAPNPDIWRLGNPLVFAIVKFALLCLEPGRHGYRVRVTLRIPGFDQHFALAPQCDDQLRIGLGDCQFHHHRFTAVDRLGRHRVRPQ